MGQFVIECPRCGSYVEGKSGFFAKRKIRCSCGNQIDIVNDRWTSRRCVHCGNMVVFDQTLGQKARCPVCQQPINTLEQQVRTEEIVCARCGIRFRTMKGEERAVCPACDYENDVQKQLMKEKHRAEENVSCIRFDDDAKTLVWRYPFEDIVPGKEVLVHESQEAIFFRDGKALDLFGPGRHVLEVQQPSGEEKSRKQSADKTPAFCEIYFINTGIQTGIRWGTDSKVRAVDPVFGIPVDLGACGEFNIRVRDSRRLLLKLAGTGTVLTPEQNNNGFFRTIVMNQVKVCLAPVLREKEINLLEIHEHMRELSEALKEKINEYFYGYGVEMTDFFVSKVVTPDNDPEFRRLWELYRGQRQQAQEESQQPET